MKGDPMFRTRESNEFQEIFQQDFPGRGNGKIKKKSSSILEEVARTETTTVV